MAKVLSVDVDILFKDMRKYQKYIDEDLTPEQSWQVIEWKTGTQNYLIDLPTLEYISELIKTRLKEGAETITIQHHHEILSLLPEGSDVVNLDYHHDITYNRNDEEINIENWVLHGRQRDLIKNYTWIHQDNSELCLVSPFNYNRASWKDYPVENHIEYDLLVICVSPHFTPLKFHKLFTKEVETSDEDLVEQ